MTPMEHDLTLRREYEALTRQATKTGQYPAMPPELLACTSLPSVDHWQIVHMPTVGPVLAGWAIRHPVLGPSDCWFVSTRIERIDPAGQWAWSANHLFRLLRPADPLHTARIMGQPDTPTPPDDEAEPDLDCDGFDPPPDLGIAF